MNILTALNEFLWDRVAIFLVLGCGVFLTFRLRFFQLIYFPHWIKATLGGMRGGKTALQEKGAISQFQGLCTTLAATVGVGNIVGVSSAVCLGGAGAVFWMWIAAFFGMATAYAENLLGVLYRKTDSDGNTQGGAMYYLRQCLGGRTLGKILAAVFSLCTVLVSFCMGNISQINAITENLCASFPIAALENIKIGGGSLYALLCGVLLCFAVGSVTIGGISRIAKITEKVVPAMIIAFLAASVLVLFHNRQNIMPAVSLIFRQAFSSRALSGGVAGTAVKQAISVGLKRGLFSNEAGLGSTVAANASSNVTEPAVGGMWGMLSVFIDTIVMCTLTALLILSSGLVDLKHGAILSHTAHTVLTAEVFSSVFGKGGTVFITIFILLFAYSTVLGWSHFGCAAWVYLFGKNTQHIYKALFVLIIIPAATMGGNLTLNIADTANALMLIPNIIGVVSLSPLVIKTTSDYKSRIIRRGR